MKASRDEIDICGWGHCTVFFIFILGLCEGLAWLRSVCQYPITCLYFLKLTLLVHPLQLECLKSTLERSLIQIFKKIIYLVALFKHRNVIAGLPTLRTLPYFYGISSEFDSTTDTTNLVNKLRKMTPEVCISANYRNSVNPRKNDHGNKGT